MSLSLDSCVTFSGFDCVVPLSSEKGGFMGFMGEGACGWKGTLGVESGKILNSLSLCPSSLAL